MWIKHLIDQEVYGVGDTLTLKLKEIHELEGKKTDNYEFEELDSKQKININVFPSENLIIGETYKYTINKIDGIYVNGTFTHKDNGTQTSLGDLFDEITMEYDEELAVDDWLSTRREQLEKELNIIKALQERV
jgi:hypothetical protein